MKDMMTTTDATASTEARIIAIIAQQALMDPADISPDAKLTDLGLDSLAMMEIVFGLEEAFDVTIPLNANDTAHSVDLSSVTSIAAAIRGLQTA